MNKMKNIPGMKNMDQMLKKMGLNTNGQKVNMNAMKSALNMNMKKSSQKERMLRKLEKRRMEKEIQAKKKDVSTKSRNLVIHLLWLIINTFCLLLLRPFLPSVNIVNLIMIFVFL